MINRKIIGTLLLISMITNASAQEIFSNKIRGMRINGSVSGALPICGLSSQPIKIEIDYNCDHPEFIRARFIHCNKNWIRTPSLLINDDAINLTMDRIAYEPVPIGVKEYYFQYILEVPGFPRFERFHFSGNYIVEILDEDGKNTLARGRFIVTENSVSALMKIDNRYIPLQRYPFKKGHRVSMLVNIPEPEDSESELFPFQLTTVDVYRNRELYHRTRIDINERTSSTHLEGFGTRKIVFSADEILPGNNYRVIDLRNSDRYSPGKIHRAFEGADVSRFPFKASNDNNGNSFLTRGNRYADYINFQFELLSEYNGNDTVYVVGDFNGWMPSKESQMMYDPVTSRYIHSVSLRRGQYDYQYVLNGNDWIAYEGNDWRTINLYTAVVYYHDFRKGGYDRVLKVVQRYSQSTQEPTAD